jgi:hypothetical protein
MRLPADAKEVESLILKFGSLGSYKWHDDLAANFAKNEGEKQSREMRRHDG